MANWDIFHSDRLEVERNLSPAQIRDGLKRGTIRDDDLARPAGTSETWARLLDIPGLNATLAGPVADEPAEDMSQFLVDEEDEELDEPAAPPTSRGLITPPSLSSHRPGNVPMSDDVSKATTEDLDPQGFPDSYDRDLDLDLRDPHSKVVLPMEEGGGLDPLAEDEEAAEFTLARGGAETVEELDLAAMVDVAFQLVLFFLVTASTVVFKTLEVPKPNPEQPPPGAATQTASTARKTIDELQDSYILVDVDENGAVKVDRETAPSDFNGLVDRLRKLRTESGRTAILLTANNATRHKNAVNIFDVANEIGLKIGIAQPKAAPAANTIPPAAPK